MANKTRQVHKRRKRRSRIQRARDRRSFKEADDRAWKECEEEVRAKVTALWAAGEFGPFYHPEGAKRKYPGEAEATAVVDHMTYYLPTYSTKKKLKAFLKEFSILRDYEEQRQKGNDHASDEVGRVWMRLMKRIREDHIVTVDVRGDGLLVQPTRAEGISALALLSLSVRYRRLTRIRPCLHCGSVFYARFDHQQFCPDPEKKCQWHHYHSPEWRKKHRERTKQLQKEYRERIFGKARPKLVAHK
jgi:hypothetical protein